MRSGGSVEVDACPTVCVCAMRPTWVRNFIDSLADIAEVNQTFIDNATGE